MKVNVYLKYNTPRAGGGISPFVLAAADGFRAHGHDVNLLQPGNPQPCDLACVWGVKKKHVMSFHADQDIVVLERAYVEDRYHWTSFGWNGLNGRADFGNKGMSGDRWDFYFRHLMKPWRGNYEGDYVLIMGQVPTDAAVASYVDFGGWVNRTARGLMRLGLKPVFRPHPQAPYSIVASACKVHRGTMEEALAGAQWVVTFNSNSAVDAVLAGIPTVAVDEGTMAWDVTGRNPFERPPMPDRSQWAYDLAYTQWTPEELADGVAWEHLRQCRSLS